MTTIKEFTTGAKTRMMFALAGLGVMAPAETIPAGSLVMAVSAVRK